MPKRGDTPNGTENKPDVTRVQQAIDVLAEQGFIIWEDGGWKITPAGQRCYEIASASSARGTRS